LQGKTLERPLLYWPPGGSRMAKAQTVDSRPLQKVVSNVDAMFFLTISILLMSVVVAISLR
jgi:hypothetical protein